MIKLEKTEVSGWETAIRGMRNPLNSWDKSDSTQLYSYDGNKDDFIVGENDLTLMKKLVKAGSDHRKFMRFITVSVDITAPLYWWSEYDTYKVGTVANSCSKMHKLLHKPFEMSDFSFDKLPGYKREVKQFTPEVDEDREVWKPTCEDDSYEVSNYGRVRHNGRVLSGSIHSDIINDKYKYVEKVNVFETVARPIVDMLNELRDAWYLEEDADKKKQIWYAILQLLPESYNQKRTVLLNYEVLRNMYHARKAHKLDDWRDLCKWIETLPYHELITEE